MRSPLYLPLVWYPYPYTSSRKPSSAKIFTCVPEAIWHHKSLIEDRILKFYIWIGLENLKCYQTVPIHGIKIHSINCKVLTICLKIFIIYHLVHLFSFSKLWFITVFLLFVSEGQDCKCISILMQYVIFHNFYKSKYFTFCCLTKWMQIIICYIEKLA